MGTDGQSKGIGEDAEARDEGDFQLAYKTL